jgi:CDP-diacylglycerol pyrophosphatase
MPRLRRSACWLLIGALAAPLAACGQNRDALREIAQHQCYPHWVAAHEPKPCERLVLPDSTGVRDGYAVLHDRKGGAHFLLIPTRTLPGIESPELLAAGAPNYFAAAWTVRAELEQTVGHALVREAIGMAVNSQHARSQDQLHIHVECLQPRVRAALEVNAARLSDRWTSFALDGWDLVGRRIRGASLGASPFALLAAGLPDAKRDMGRYSLLVAGVALADGPGFAVLAGTGPGTERLLDATCAGV